jgi:hypothetical protein
MFFICAFSPVSRSRSSSVSFLVTWVASTVVCFNPLQALPRCFFHLSLGSFPVLLLCGSSSCRRFWRVCSSLRSVASHVLCQISLLRVHSVGSCALRWTIVLWAPGDSCQLQSTQSLLIRRSAQSILIRVSSACECVDFSGVSSISRLLCSPLDCSVVSPGRLNQIRSAQSLFLLISICCIAGLLSNSESVPIFFPAHARRIPRSQTKVSPVFPAASICATKDLARAPRFTRCEFLVGSSASWSHSFVFLLAL